MRKYVITGSDGFIGFWLTKKLLEQHCHVIGVDNDLRGGKQTNNNSGPNFTRLDMDLSDRANVSELVSLIDNDTVIFHLAAYNGTDNFYEKPWDVIKNTFASS